MCWNYLCIYRKESINKEKQNKTKQYKTKRIYIYIYKTEPMKRAFKRHSIRIDLSKEDKKNLSNMSIC